MSRVRLVSSIFNLHRVFFQPPRRCFASEPAGVKGSALGGAEGVDLGVRNTYETYVQEVLKHKKTSKLPQWLERLIAVTRLKLGLMDRSMDPELRLVSAEGGGKELLTRWAFCSRAGSVTGDGSWAQHYIPDGLQLLDKSSAQLYYSCANNIPYSSLLRVIGLPDALSSWFKLMILHVWMVLLRLHVSLEPVAYERFYRGMIASLWVDVDKRMDIIKDMTKRRPTSGQMRVAQGVLLQALIEYDEGFLADDRLLAAAVWRNLYNAEHFDPLHVLRLVNYIRDTVAFLDAIDANQLMLTAIDTWEPAETFAAKEWE